MKLYTCEHCGNPLYFENTVCINCNHPVGFDANKLSMITLVSSDNNTFTNVNKSNESYRLCDNAHRGICNWLVPKDNNTDVFCKACSLNRIIPILTTQQNIQRWSKMEIAKHRLVYSLLQLKLPVRSKLGDGTDGIAFDFMEDLYQGERVMTGHDDGTITINIDEADEAERVKYKLDLGERYRTLLGHFRHEIGHYYWDVLIKKKDPENYRKFFGNEERDYSEALEEYYKTGAPTDWLDHFISPYATAHPWEDWAETWAHYLHMMDTLETAFSFGINIDPKKSDNDMKAKINQDPYTIDKFDTIVKMWLPLTFALNSLSRSMGHVDFYPFVISKPVIEKLRFIHEFVEIIDASNLTDGYG